MGTTPGQSMEGSKKIDMNIFLSKYSEKYKLESFLRKDNFKTLLVTSLKKSEFAEGIPLVIKLFPIENENYYFKYSQEFTEIKNMYSNLESSPHVIPIIKLKQMKEANAGIVIRQYIKYNLKHALYYLTLSSEIEKKWICFQLLQGLNQIHSKLKCHGDIKPENILISSKLSVFLSDISVYKPVYLIIENLQLYNNYFYSNSVDRACYLAPERFVHNLNGIGKNKINELNKEMDIFSLGIVFAEIKGDVLGCRRLFKLFVLHGNASKSCKIKGGCVMAFAVKPRGCIKMGVFKSHLKGAPVHKRNKGLDTAAYRLCRRVCGIIA